MSEILYIDTSDVRDGALEELKRAIKGLVDFVEANEPRLIAYNVYFSDDGARMTVVSVHPDSASLEYHMEIAGPLFHRFAALVTLSSIHIYGEPSENVLQQSYEKARLLGRGGRDQVRGTASSHPGTRSRVVVVEPLHAGFTRIAATAEQGSTAG